MEEKSRWVPIESNPQVIAEYLEALGFPISQYQVTDILSCEPWALEMIPGPVCAVLLLYPITPVSTAYQATKTPDLSGGVYHLKQFISNACGTIGLIHIAANLRENEVMHCAVPLTGFFHRFLTLTDPLSSQERGQELVSNPDLFAEVKAAHSRAAAQGQTSARDRVNTHFAAFVAKNGCVYELDGRKDGPINHGPYASPETFAVSALQVIQREFLEKDPEQVEFAMLGVYFALG